MSRVNTPLTNDHLADSDCAATPDAVERRPIHAPIRTNRQLSQARQQLVRTMQFIAFGRIERLKIVKGEPTFASNTLILRTVRLGGNNQSRPEIKLLDFQLKQAFIELFKQFDLIRDGRIERLEVGAGLPQLLVVRQPPLAG